MSSDLKVNTDLRVSLGPVRGIREKTDRYDDDEDDECDEYDEYDEEDDDDDVAQWKFGYSYKPCTRVSGNLLLTGGNIHVS